MDSFHYPYDYCLASVMPDCCVAERGVKTTIIICSYSVSESGNGMFDIDYQHAPYSHPVWPLKLCLLAARRLLKRKHPLHLT